MKRSQIQRHTPLTRKTPMRRQRPDQPTGEATTARRSFHARAPLRAKPAAVRKAAAERRARRRAFLVELGELSGMGRGGRRRARGGDRPPPPGVSRAVREIVWSRAGLCCERCGAAGGGQVHHRRPRAMGGSRRPETNRPANLLLLCVACHAWVESHRAASVRLGLLVKSGATPARMPVLLARGRVLLDDVGGSHPAVQAGHGARHAMI